MLIALPTYQLILFDEERILRAVLDPLHNFHTQRGQIRWRLLSQRSNLNGRYECEYVLDVSDLLGPELGPEVLIGRLDILALRSQLDHRLTVLQL